MNTILSGDVVCEHFGSSALFLDITLEPKASLLLFVHQCISYFQLQTGCCIIVNVNVPRRDALRFLFERTLASVPCHKVMLGSYCCKPPKTSLDAEIQLLSLRCVEEVGAENYPENVCSGHLRREKLTWRASPLEMPIRLVLGSVVVWCLCTRIQKILDHLHGLRARNSPRKCLETTRTEVENAGRCF